MAPRLHGFPINPAAAAQASTQQRVAPAAVAAAQHQQPPPSPPPLLFLDVDGVLHPVGAEAGHFFQPQCMAALRSIVEATGAAIVLSSAWQAHAAGREDVNNALRSWGLPSFVATTVTGVPGSGEERRAREITAWVRAHAAACPTWVAIDDLPCDEVAPPPSLAPLLPARHFVRCNPRVGLTAALADRAIGLLGGRKACVLPMLRPVPLDVTKSGDPVPRPTTAGSSLAPPAGHEIWRTDARYGGDWRARGI